MKISYKNPVPLFVLVLSFFFSCKEKNTPGETTKKFNKDSAAMVRVRNK